MQMLAAEHAEALRAAFSEPVDVLGLSTVISDPRAIAQALGFPI
jgi:hypothetical protein